MTTVGTRPGLFPAAPARRPAGLEAELDDLRRSLTRLRDTLRRDTIANGGTPAPTGDDDA